jgi:hypothetical protein
VTSRLGVFLDWSFVDITVLGIAVWQLVSITLDLKRTRAREAEQAQKDAEDKAAFYQEQEAKRLY